MNAKDLERMEELRILVYAQVAVNHLREEGDPSYFDMYDIEPHRGRQRKAARLLEEAGIANYSRCMDAKRVKERNAYRSCRSGIGMRVVDFGNSRSYGEEQPFSLEWEDYVLNSYQKEEYLLYQGYKNISSIQGYWSNERMLPKGIIFAYWNQDKYDINRRYNKLGKLMDVKVFPKRFLTDRMRAALRANVESRLKRDLQSLVEWALEVPKDTYNHKIDSFFPTHYFSSIGKFNKEKFEGTTLEEHYDVCENSPYLRRLQALKKDLLAEIDMVEGFISRIHAYGGYEAVLEKIRRHLIEEILDDTPLEIMEPEKRVLAEYTMNNQEEFSFEKLYLESEQEIARVTT